MTDYVKRLIWVDDEKKYALNPLIWPFLVGALIYGFGFIIFGGTEAVASSSLHASLVTTNKWLPAIWGAFSLASALATIVAIVHRIAFFGRAAGMIGFLTWLFAFILYVMNGFWLVAFTVAGIYLSFWTWYYCSLSWYLTRRKAGLLQDPQ